MKRHWLETVQTDKKDQTNADIKEWVTEEKGTPFFFLCSGCMHTE